MNHAVLNFAPGPEYGVSFRFWQGCPTVLCTEKGTLFAGWYSGGSSEPSFGNYNLLIRSRDSGKTWSEPLLVIPSMKEVQIVAIDVQLWKDPEGKMRLFWVQRDLKLPKTDPRHLETWCTVCPDPDAEKLTWSEPVMIAPGFLRCRPTVLKDGRILLCAYGWTSDRYEYSESSDGGGSWTRHQGGKKCSCDFDETMVWEQRDGTLRMFARHTPFVAESVSRDGGKSWTDGQETAYPSPLSRFFIRRLASGNLLFVRNDSSETRRSMTAFLSTDDGKSFPHSLLLDGRDWVSYPDGDQAPDGSVFLVHDRERTGAKEILLSRITEEDVLAGKIVSPESFLSRVISKAPEKPYDEAAFLRWKELDQETVQRVL